MCVHKPDAAKRRRSWRWKRVEGRGLSYPAATVSAPRDCGFTDLPACLLGAKRASVKSFQYHKEVMESANSRCRQLCRHPCDTKLMLKYEGEEARGQETPRVRGLSRSGRLKLSQGLRNTNHFPSLSELCHLRCCFFSLSAALLSINITAQIKKKKKKISSC